MLLIIVNNLTAHLQVTHQQVTTHPHHGTRYRRETVFTERAMMRVEKNMYLLLYVRGGHHPPTQAWGLEDPRQKLQDLPPGSLSD